MATRPTSPPGLDAITRSDRAARNSSPAPTRPASSDRSSGRRVQLRIHDRVAALVLLGEGEPAGFPATTPAVLDLAHVDVPSVEWLGPTHNADPPGGRPSRSRVASSGGRSTSFHKPCGPRPSPMKGTTAKRSRGRRATPAVQGRAKSRHADDGGVPGGLWTTTGPSLPAGSAWVRKGWYRGRRTGVMGQRSYRHRPSCSSTVTHRGIEGRRCRGEPLPRSSPAQPPPRKPAPAR